MSDSEYVPGANPTNPFGWLVYKLVENGGVVVQTVEDAMYDHAVNVAIEEAKTWGEFRRLLPGGEWIKVYNRLIVERGYDDEERQNLQWADDSAPFDPNQICGFPNGDYPRWAQQRMHEIVPRDILARFGQWTASVHQGMFWLIPHENAKALANALRERGFHVEPTPFLRGW